MNNEQQPVKDEERLWLANYRYWEATEGKRLAEEERFKRVIGVVASLGILVFSIAWFVAYCVEHGLPPLW